MYLGLGFLIVGSLYLFKNFTSMSDAEWSILWPIVITLIGVAIVLVKMNRHNRWCTCSMCQSVRGPHHGAYGMNSGIHSGKANVCQSCAGSQCDQKVCDCECHNGVCVCKCDSCKTCNHK